MNIRTENLRGTIEKAQTSAGAILVDTKGYMKKDAVRRVVRWKDGRPWVRIAGMGFVVDSYMDMNEYLGREGKEPVYLFYTI
jgi:hypothetical protein